MVEKGAGEPKKNKKKKRRTIKEKRIICWAC